MQHVAPARISVVVPTYRRAELLREALASIRALESPALSLEILVCDNGNGEGAAPAREFGARYLVVDRPGAAAARNAGISAATGEYLAFLDDDDLWLPTHLAPKLAMLQARPEFAGVVGQTITTDESLQPTSPPWPVYQLPDNGDVFRSFLAEYPQIGSTVVRTTVRETVGLLNEADEVDGDEDWDWHLRLAMQHKIGYVAQPGILFRQRTAGTFDDLQWRRLGVMNHVMRLNMQRAGHRLPNRLTCLRIMLRHNGEFYWSFLESARRHIEHGDRRAAWRAAWYAFRSSPVHAVAGLVRPRQTGELLGMLLLGRPAPAPPANVEDDAPVILAAADRPDTAGEQVLATYGGPVSYAAPAEEWEPRKVAR